MNGIEYRVVWRWREERFRGDTKGASFPERTKLYRTEKGAQRLYEKLTSNDGRYEMVTDGTGIQTGELVTEHLKLDYARIDQRPVGEWQAAK